MLNSGQHINDTQLTIDSHYFDLTEMFVSTYYHISQNTLMRYTHLQLMMFGIGRPEPMWFFFLQF